MTGGPAPENLDTSKTKEAAVKLLVIQYSADPKRSSEFYQALGLPLDAARSEAAWIEHEASAATLAVHRDDPEYPGGGHEIFFVTDEPLEVVAARLEVLGYPTRAKDEPWGRTLSTTDPDGARVQCYQGG